LLIGSGVCSVVVVTPLWWKYKNRIIALLTLFINYYLFRSPIVFFLLLSSRIIVLILIIRYNYFSQCCCLLVVGCCLVSCCWGLLSWVGVWVVCEASFVSYLPYCQEPTTTNTHTQTTNTSHAHNNFGFLGSLWRIEFGLVADNCRQTSRVCLCSNICLWRRRLSAQFLANTRPRSLLRGHLSFSSLSCSSIHTSNSFHPLSCYEPSFNRCYSLQRDF
jgi:hypothetical protein